MEGIDEEEQRKVYLDNIRKRAKDMPKLARTFEETKSDRVALSKETEPDKNKKKQ